MRGAACFPNVARFDYFDSAGGGSTQLHFRVQLLRSAHAVFCGAEAALPQALDPIPQGTEIVMSYFPISLPRAERQQRLLSDYGFSCKCVSLVARILPRGGS